MGKNPLINKETVYIVISLKGKMFMGKNKIITAENSNEKIM